MGEIEKIKYQNYTDNKMGELMTMKGKIKVIKKGEPSKMTAVAEKTAISEKTSTQAAREMVSNVTNWVTEFQQRRREETKQAFEKFLAPRPQTSGV